VGTTLPGARALVTGGTSGIGLGIVERFLAEGAAVVFTGRDEERGADVAARLGAAATFVAADAADEASAESSVEQAREILGGVDILVANAGIALVERLADTPVAEFDRLISHNLRSAFLYARACLPLLAERRGSMIHIASDAGLRGEQAIGAYSVAKAAVVMLAKMFALDGAATGVRSNCICPGTTLPGMRHIGPAADPEQGDDPSGWSLPPLGRHGTSADVAGVAAFLAGPEASHISGAVILVDGAGAAGLPA
jgi:meso-butanediol dehydrogenase/(S,S)-butanediol dehydrogenase/diacetyl reductase